MRRIDTSDGRFHKNIPGNPAPATQPKDWWINDIQEELVNVVTKLGKMELNENDNSQLAQAFDRYMKEPKPVNVIAIPGQTLVSAPTTLSLEAIGSYFNLFSCVCEQLLAEGPKYIPFNFVLHKVPDAGSWKCTLIPLVENAIIPLLLSVSEMEQIQVRTTPDWPAGLSGRVHLVLNRRERS